jgi:hypothetical protein
LRLRHLLVAAGLIAALSFPIPLAFPVNSWQPLVVHFWLLPQLAVLFVLGLAAGERGWLAGRPPPLVRRVCWLAPPSALAVLAGTVLATAVAGLYAALSGSARSPIPAVEPSEAELPRGVITKRLSWRCQVSPLLGLLHRRWAATQSSRTPPRLEPVRPRLSALVGGRVHVPPWAPHGLQDQQQRVEPAGSQLLQPPLQVAVPVQRVAHVPAGVGVAQPNASLRRNPVRRWRRNRPSGSSDWPT